MFNINMRFVIALCSITAVVLIIMAFSAVQSGRTGKSPFVSSASGYVITPIQKFFSHLGGLASGGANYFKEMASSRKLYAALLERNDDLERQNRDLTELINENQRLRDLLNFKERNPHYKTIGAKVIAKDPGNYFNTFVIDRGSRDNVKKNSPVTTDKGLVGHVVEVASSFSKVIAVTDPKYAVGVNIIRCDATAVVEGDITLSAKDLCYMKYIDKGSGAVVGDYVETSGLGGIYPRGLLVGKISEIYTDPQGLYHMAILETAVDFSSLYECLVIDEEYENYEEYAQ